MGDWDVYECEACGKAFGSPEELDRHAKRHRRTPRSTSVAVAPPTVAPPAVAVSADVAAGICVLLDNYRKGWGRSAGWTRDAARTDRPPSQALHDAVRRWLASAAGVEATPSEEVPRRARRR